MSSTFGTLFRVATFSESHGGMVGAVVDGCPPRLPLVEADVQRQLDRRRPGQSRLGTAREEADAILSPAQESILAYWNKNPDAQPEIDHELEEPLLDALMSRFDGYEPEIDAAIAEAEVRATSGVEDDAKEASCEFDESCDAPETDTVAAAD